MKDRTLFRLGSLAAWIGTITLVILAMAVDADSVSLNGFLHTGAIATGSMLVGLLAIRQADGERK